MSAELPITFLTVDPSRTRYSMRIIAANALKAAARFWFIVTVAGQLLFAFAVASFYGLSALRGDFHRWGKSITNGHVPGDTMGNLVVELHLISAVIIILSGALQLIPMFRQRFPLFHRWNGRVYMLAAVTVSGAGVYMLWFRGSVADLSQRIGFTLDVVLIWLCAAMALRYAIARNFASHRVWALRLFLVASASWFFRVELFASFLIFRGPFGFDPLSFSGPFLTFLSYAQYLLPLAVLELYLFAQKSAGSLRRMATAFVLFVMTIGTAAATFALTMAVWVPEVKAGFDTRTSITETLSATIASGGVDQAIRQYHQLKAANPATYNFDQGELNILGYQLLRKKQFSDAIRIFQLNVEAYPQASNVYDSLAEAYADILNVPLAVANYQKALQLNPKNRTATAGLKKLAAYGAAHAGSPGGSQAEGASQ